MEKENKILKNILKRKIKMTTAVLVAFLISGSLSFASGGASGIPDVVGEDLTDLYLEPGTYTPDEDGNINMTLIHRQAGNGEDTPDDYKYNMPEEEYNKLSDHDKELLQKRRVKIKNVVSKDKMTGNVTSSTLTVTNGEKRLYGPDELTVELKEKSITLNHISDDLKNYIDNRSAAGGTSGGGTAAPTNITSTTLNVTDAADGSGKNIELKNDTVDTAHLKDNAVTTEKINNGAVTAGKLAENSVTTEKIVNGNVTTEKLADGAVTTNKLGDNSVSTAKIQDGAVSKDKLSNALKTEIEGKVNRTDFTGDITSNTITVTNGNNKLLEDVNLEVADGAITAGKLATNAVTSEKINNGAVSKDKLSDALKTEIDGKANKTEVYTKIDEVSITKDADGNGTVDVKGKDGKSGVSLNGKDGSIGINGKDGNSVSMTTEKGPKGIGKENEKPRMTYEFTNEKKNPDGTPVIDPATNKPVTETVKETLATMNDGLYFAGDNNATTISKKLNEKLEIVGGADRDKLTKNNIGVNANAEGKLEVQLSKELKGMRSAEFTDPNTGNIVKITGEGTTITNPKTGDTVIMNQGGITISKTDKDGKPNNVSLSREGLSNGGNKITNVAAGDISEGSTDVVNGRQLHQVQAQVDQNAQNIQNVNQKVDRLGERVNKGLAGAAAMSGIEFMEIGINQATVAAAVGGYRGTHAVAVGVQAAPTENTRVNAKMSLTPGSRTEVMYSVGAAYRFNLK